MTTNLKLKITFVIFLISLTYITFLQSQEYSIPNQKEIEKRINYLQRVISQPLEPNSEIMLLGNENKEFMLFTYAYSSYALTNLALRDSIYKNQAIDLIKKSILKTLDKKIYSSYGVDNSLIKLDSIPDYSVLYLGHLNLMIGCYRLISKDNIFNNLNDKISKSLFKRYNDSKFLNLESYNSSIWIPDNSVAIASLNLYSKNANNGFDEICKKWIQFVKTNYVENKTGVLFSTINPLTGQPKEEPRGSMIGWSIMFIYQFDSNFAIDLYEKYKTNFSDNLLIFRLFKERFKNRKTNFGDIDSGPIFLGYSIPANEFALSNSILAGDLKTAKKLERLLNFGTKKINKNNEFKFKVRFVNMNISPMAEAIVLNSLTITNWTND